MAEQHGESKGPQGEGLPPRARHNLLKVARLAVEDAVKRRRPPSIKLTDPELQEKQGAFVTLRMHGHLRGCIGHFTSDEPLWKTVQDVAVLSATQDPRFMDMRLRPEDLKHLQVEISVLSPLRKIDNPLDIELGKHGIYIRRGAHSGCFLPQVAAETGWSKEEFLSYCCASKAGLPADAWKDPNTEVLAFTAEIVSEGEQA